MVKLNLGVGILAPWIAEKDLASGALRLRPLANKPLTRRWAVLSLPTRRLNLAEEDLCRLCSRHATALRLDRKDVPASGR